MLNKIAIGKYYYGTSIIHQWNPIIKLICSFCFILFLFMSEQIFIGFLFGMMLFFLMCLSGVSFCYYIRLVWQIRYMLIFLFLFNWMFGVSFVQNSFLSFKLICVIIYSSILLYTTSISDLTYAITFLLYPLSWIHIPIHLISHMIGLALSFLSNMIEHTNCILKSLSVRGMDYKSSSLKQRLYIWKIILFPLFDLALHHADCVADTMEVRLYHIESKKFHFRKLPIHIFDIIQLILHLSICTLVMKEGVICGI